MRSLTLFIVILITVIALSCVQARRRRFKHVTADDDAESRHVNEPAPTRSKLHDHRHQAMKGSKAHSSHSSRFKSNPASDDYLESGDDSDGFEKRTHKDGKKNWYKKVLMEDVDSDEDDDSMEDIDSFDDTDSQKFGEPARDQDHDSHFEIRNSRVKSNPIPVGLPDPRFQNEVDVSTKVSVNLDENKNKPIPNGDMNPHLLNETIPSHVQLNVHRADLRDPQIKSSPISSQFIDSGLMDAGDAFARTAVNNRNTHLSPIVVGHAVTVIIVVCVGFLVFLIVLGVIRVRAAHRGSVVRNGSANRDEDQELVWDDTALTIRINPFDQLEGGNGVGECETVLSGSHHNGSGHRHSSHTRDQESDGESDTSSNESYHEDDQDDSDDELEGAVGGVSITSGKNKDNFVWDDSALGF